MAKSLSILLLYLYFILTVSLIFRYMLIQYFLAIDYSFSMYTILKYFRQENHYYIKRPIHTIKYSNAFILDSRSFINFLDQQHN